MTRRRALVWVAAGAAALACARPSAAAPSIRVQLLHNQLDVVLSADEGLGVRPLSFDPSDAPMLEPEITTVLDIRAQPGGMLLAGAIPVRGPIAVAPQLSSRLSVDGRAYRGTAIVQPDLDGTLGVIDVVDLDKYLYGVIAAEMPASWPQAALQAQAIIARSYVLAKMGNPSHPSYDVEAGEQDQVYDGIAAETDDTSAAVDATRGLILVYGGQIATAYYSACDGGYTSDGWALADPQPYLQAKPDPYCSLSPYMRWQASVPTAAFEAAFTGAVGDIGTITDVQIRSTDASGRAQTLSVIGTAGSRIISGTKFRLLAGQHLVKSLRIASLQLTGDRIEVSGSGFGHGVGLCQYGARGMAAAGYDASDILRFYYPGALLTSLVER